MLDRIAAHLWFELAMLPAVVNDDGDVCRITSKCRERLEDAMRPWTVEERMQKDQTIIDQWKTMFGSPNSSNPIAEAIKKQQMIIAGLAKAEQ